VMRSPVILEPGAGRSDPPDRMGAQFKVDGEKAWNNCCRSSWWLDPQAKGPGMPTIADWFAKNPTGDA
uniref:hypothetical protein n=1 Tax=Escherichia coli TaxID=562 RepID=UPI0019530AC3